MIVVAIMGILAGIAYPLMLSWLPNMRLRGTARDVYSVMQRARAEAIERGVNVTVGFSTATDAYILFLDNGAGINAGNDVLDADESALLRSGPLPDGVAFDDRPAPPAPLTATKGTDGIVDGVSFSSNALVFTPRGLPASIGTVALWVPTTGTKRTVTVSIAGRVKTNMGEPQ
jgi:type II secretory pathway pseudopilin PulG